MEFSFKKPLIFLAVVIAAVWYVRTYHSLQDVLRYARKKPDKPAGAMLEYYAGMAYYMRGRYKPAAQAFEQLLERCATCHAYGDKALLRLGTADEYLENWQGARDAYLKYLELFPAGTDRNLVQVRYDQVKFKGVQ